MIHPHTEQPHLARTDPAPTALIIIPMGGADVWIEGEMMLTGLYQWQGGTWINLETDEEPDAPFWWVLESDALAAFSAPKHHDYETGD